MIVLIKINFIATEIKLYRGTAIDYVFPTPSNSYEFENLRWKCCSSGKMLLKKTHQLRKKLWKFVPGLRDFLGAVNSVYPSLLKERNGEV